MSTFTQQWIEAWNNHYAGGVASMRLEIPDGVPGNDNHPYNYIHRMENIAKIFFCAFPDLQFDVLETVENGDKLALLWKVNGTHKGRYNNIPPTGKKMEVKGASFFELKDGKMIKACFLWDEAELLRQMKLLPDKRIERPNICKIDYVVNPVQIT